MARTVPSPRPRQNGAICRGCINASRKRNKELAAAGTLVPRGRLLAQTPEAQAPAALLQALPEEDIRQPSNKEITNGTNTTPQSPCQLLPC